MAEVGIQHGNQRKHKQDAEVDGRIESYVLMDRNARQVDHEFIGYFDNHSHKQERNGREQEVLGI